VEVPALAKADAQARPLQRILIVRLSAMGDIIHALPAATALRLAFPEAMIGWAIEERWAELLCTLPNPRSGPRSAQRPLVDRIHIVNSARWRSTLLSTQTWEQIAAGLSELRAARYQLAIDFQGAARSALIARWSGAPTIFGETQPRENIASMFYTRQIIAQGAHVIEQNMSLAEAVAQRQLPMPVVEFPRDELAEKDCEQRLRELGMGRFAILNPGAGWGAKQWPAERYGEVAHQLANDGLKSIINYGPNEEALAQTVEATSQGAAKVLSCSVTQLIALMRRASLFVGGDTGPLHLATALGVPSVALFGPTNPARNGPYGARSIVLRSATSATSHARRSDADPGLLEISADDVVRAARRLLETSHD
jgi:heptosyltransferase-1